ncbi:MAG: N-acetylmuramoyl-L-alanine amidase [Calothrix sp. SM1_7_51]|nr:N-acetylmuramoyl-L-alanine amidase [Calothrix sp. SM1_7_51]
MSVSAELGTTNKELNNGQKFLVAQVTAEFGITRNAPDDEALRLTPLPRGTRALIKERKKDWLRLDYGAWINQEETRVLATPSSPRSLICNVVFRKQPDKTEVIFPLQAPVPVTIQQGQGWFALTLHNTIARHSLKSPEDDPVISQMNQRMSTNGQVIYGFNFRSPQQWGYNLRYEGTNLILSLRKSPFAEQGGFFADAIKSGLPLSGISIAIDPGHGGIDSGAKTNSGYQEKDLTLTLSQLLRQELELRGATVHLTRESDVYLSLEERVATIERIKPAIAISVHYNHVPENVNGSNIQGVSTYWFHPQSRSLAEFLLNQMHTKLKRKSFEMKMEKSSS